MKTYRFETTATMKEYNNNKYWIDRGIIRPIIIQAETVKQALLKYRDIVAERDYIIISNNALKNKNAMYIDTAAGEAIQTGYVLTGSTEIYDQSANINGSKQYIDLWVKIEIVSYPDFD